MALLGKSDSECADLLANTLEDLDKLKFETVQPLQRYEAVDRWFTKDKEVIPDGDSISRRIQLDQGNGAEHVRLYQPSTIRVADLMSVITAGWVHAETQWSIDRREQAMNSGASRIVDTLKSRRVDALMRLCDLLEDDGWTSPAGPTDDLHALGITYWINALADGQAGEGFYGCYDSTNGFSNAGGIAAATASPNTTAPTGGKAYWRNYAAGGTGYYTSIDIEAMDTLRKMFDKLDFRSPVIVDDLKSESQKNFSIYMNCDTEIGFNRLAKAQNDQLGSDLDPFAGRIAFRRVPLAVVPKLDSDTRNPIYLVNHRVFKVYTLKDEWLRESAPMNSRENRNVFTSFLDLTFQIVCENKRLQGVMRKTA